MKTNTEHKEQIKTGHTKIMESILPTIKHGIIIQVHNHEIPHKQNHSKIQVGGHVKTWDYCLELDPCT